MTSHSNVRVSNELKYIKNGPLESEKYPVQVRYCTDCSFPLDYADYSPVKNCSCKEELLSEQLDKVKIVGGIGSNAIHGAAGSGDATAATTASGDDDDEVVGEDGKKRQKRGGKTASKSVAKAKKELHGPSEIRIYTAPRGKKKFVTVVSGLGKNGIDLKVAAKVFGTKFACGSSVSGDDEIVIQGDVKDDLIDLIPEKWPQIDEDLIEDDGEHKRT